MGESTVAPVIELAGGLPGICGQINMPAVVLILDDQQHLPQGALPAATVAPAIAGSLNPPTTAQRPLLRRPPGWRQRLSSFASRQT